MVNLLLSIDVNFFLICKLIILGRGLLYILNVLV